MNGISFLLVLYIFLGIIVSIFFKLAMPPMKGSWTKMDLVVIAIVWPVALAALISPSRWRDKK